MKRTKTRKHIIQLPSNFAEVVILKEMKFSNGDRSIELIRELLYLYSIGMEYYDSINNKLIYSYYYQRNIAMLTDSEVTAILDGNPNKGHNPDIKLFKDDKPYKLITINDDLKNKNQKLDSQNNMTNSKDIIGPTKESHFSFVNNQPTKQVVKSRIDSEMDKLKSHVEQLDNLVENVKTTQLNSFQLKRQKKVEAMKEKPKNKKQFVIRRGSKIDDLLIAAVSHGKTEGADKSEILKSIYELTEKNLESNQAGMMKEIEDYIDKNMNEMHEALEELRVSFEDELKGLDQDVFADVIKAMKEDMGIELSNLRDQYEELRRDGVEKIKAKYNKKK